jgi:hypothetical protein
MFTTATLRIALSAADRGARRRHQKTCDKTADDKADREELPRNEETGREGRGTVNVDEAKEPEDGENVAARHIGQAWEKGAPPLLATSKKVGLLLIVLLPFVVLDRQQGRLDGEIGGSFRRESIVHVLKARGPGLGLSLILPSSSISSNIINSELMIAWMHPSFPFSSLLSADEKERRGER